MGQKNALPSSEAGGLGKKTWEVETEIRVKDYFGGKGEKKGNAAKELNLERGKKKKKKKTLKNRREKKKDMMRMHSKKKGGISVNISGERVWVVGRGKKQKGEVLTGVCKPKKKNEEKGIC